MAEALGAPTKEERHRNFMRWLNAAIQQQHIKEREASFDKRFNRTHNIRWTDPVGQLAEQQLNQGKMDAYQDITGWGPDNHYYRSYGKMTPQGEHGIAQQIVDLMTGSAQ